MEAGTIGEEEIEQEQDQEAEQVVYCAVGKEAKEWKANLQWVLGNVPRSKHLVLAHVHRPASRINMMGAWVPVRHLAEQEVTAHRQLEKQMISKVMDDLLVVCKSQKVNVSKIVIESDDIAGGLVQFIDDHGVTELVMGAASDRQYTRKMRKPRSKKALTVQRKANPNCKIRFVCKGNIICTREVGEGLNRIDSSTTSSSSRSSNSDCTRSSTSDFTRSKSSCLHSEPSNTQESTDPTPLLLDHTPSREDTTMDHCVEAFNEVATVVVPAVMEAEEEPAVLQSLQEAEDDPQTPFQDGSDAAQTDDDLYEKLKDALIEADNLKSEAYEETCRRQKAERDLADVSRMAKDAENSYRREAKHRKETEETLVREQSEMEQDRQELNNKLEQIQNVNDQSAKLELQIMNSERMMGALEIRLSESYRLLETLQLEHRKENPATESAVRGQHQNSNHRVSFLRFSYSELMEATDHFDESVRISGAAGRGSIYKGNLRNMTVSIKLLNPDVAIDELEFTQEVETISRVRHPSLVTLVGACPEERAVVHEFMLGGSLEDRLGGKSGAPPLPWHARCGIAYRTCTALAFLHSTEPKPTVHGNVTPANILLDEQFSSKLSGLGMRRLIDRSRNTALARPPLAYVDPHYLATGKLTPQCDVYSLGVVLLQLVTGKPAFLAKKAGREAAEGYTGWHDVVDASAGGWPLEQAKEVVLLGLKCCDVKRRRCPAELLEEARCALEAAMSAALGRTPSSRSSESDGEGSSSIPSYFLCPVFKEVMRDPHIAGDGFTYEEVAIRGWLENGHDTSPMTNLKLSTTELIPNHALRSAIQEWLQKRRHLLGFSNLYH